MPRILLLAASLAGFAIFASPIVPGASGDHAGEILIGELNCVACHAAESATATRLNAKSAPDLSNAGGRLTPQYLSAYLDAPHAVRPGSMMPDPLHGLADRADTVEAITHYLMSRGELPEEMLGGSETEAEEGKKLFESIGCAACHNPEGGKYGADSVPLDGLASKTTVTALTAFLQDPHKTRPGSRMPDFRLDFGEAKKLAVYLLREQLANPQNETAAPAARPGVAYKLFYGGYTNKEKRLLTEEPKFTGIHPNFRLDTPDRKQNSNYAYVFESSIRIEKDGEYSFSLNSDDSSFMWINDKQIIGLPGAHAMQKKQGKITLKAGLHDMRVIFTQGGGGAGLEVKWTPPGGKEGFIPDDLLSSSGGKPMLPLGTIDFTVDEAKAATGKAAYEKFGCASCHDSAAPTAKPLAELKSGGCLAPKPPAAAPNFALSADQRAAITKALASDLSKPLKAHERVTRTVAKFNCVACHKRGNVGGPQQRDELFTMTEKLDLGDEGRFPPMLSGAGAKLKLDALKGIIHHGQFHIRSHMATRMPSFAESATGKLAEDFVEADAKPEDLRPVGFDSAAIKDARKLVGNTGLGCVNCHKVAGHNSLGINTVDIATVGQRLNPAWLRRFLTEPSAFSPGTVMPALWTNGVVLKDLAGGTVESQQDAIYSYLSLGKSMPLPPGIQAKAGGNVLTPAGEPLVLRTFVDGASPRGIVIGYPERVHAMFDANQVRMVKFWRGEFFDPKGAWSARNMKFNGPAGTDVVDIPGPTFAQLEAADSAWPAVEKNGREVGGKFKGYRLDKERVPIFKYQLGEATIEERLAPELVIGGAAMARQFTLTGSAQGLFAKLATGKSITAREGGIYIVDGGLTLTFKTDQKPTIRDAKDGKELLLAIPDDAANFSFEVLYSW